MTDAPLAPTFDDLRLAAGRIHHGGRRFVIAFTGGGSEAISALMTTPGASRSVLEAVIPYSQAALVEFVGSRPEQFCSEQTARAMAAAAWRRARELERANGLSVEAGSQAAGWAATCSLATDREKRGAHRAFAARIDERGLTTHALTFDPTRSRETQERLAAAWLLNVAAEACGVVERLPLPLFAHERVERAESPARGRWADLLAGRTAVAFRDEDQSPRGGEASADLVLLAGSFNPRHEGHRLMAETAARKLGRPVDWEVSVTNVDKPPLDYLALAERLAQFAADERVWFTRAPKFLDKARLFRRATFVVGVDTIRRIGDPRYYGGEPAARDAEIAELAREGTRFLVFPRLDGDRFVGLADLDLPPELLTICDGVGRDEFRCDVSSTELRRRTPDAG